MISFACPKCGKPLRVKDDFAGKQVKCPDGGHVVSVPAHSQITAKGEETAPSAADHRETYDFLAPAQKPDELGRLGHYRVLKVLGAGGMGVVFLAEDVRLQRQVALKAMLPALAASAAARQRFLREARAAAAIEHDNIVPIYQVDQDRGIPFLAMPFLKGQPLDEVLKKKGRLPLAQVLRIGRETALGLAAAHAKGLVHRDIKPANLWLEETGVRSQEPDSRQAFRVKILDFGLARGGEGTSQLTQANAILGTPAYMSPEQATNQTLDGRCDLFSLGCVLYRLCTGEFPFKGSDALTTLLAVATEEPKPPRALNRELPPRLSKLVMRLLEKKPEDRPASAQKVADLLAAIERGDADEAGDFRKPKKKPRRPRWLIPTLAGGVSVAAIVLVSILWPRGEIEPVDPHGELAARDKDMEKSPPEGKLNLPLGDKPTPPTDKVIPPAEESKAAPVGEKDGSVKTKTPPGDKLLTKKDKKGPLKASIYNRGVAEWALDLGATVEVESEGARHPVKQKTDIPKKIPFVVKLDFHDKQSLHDDDLIRLGGLAKLEEIGLARTGISDAGLGYLQGVGNLVTLHLDETEVGDTGLSRLKSHLKLQTLTLRKTKITDKGLIHLKGLDKLKTLALANTHVTDKGMVSLHPLTNLTVLDLANTEVTDVAVKLLRKTLPKLQIKR